MQAQLVLLQYRTRNQPPRTTASRGSQQQLSEKQLPQPALLNSTGPKGGCRTASLAQVQLRRGAFKTYLQRRWTFCFSGIQTLRPAPQKPSTCSTFHKGPWTSAAPSAAAAASNTPSGTTARIQPGDPGIRSKKGLADHPYWHFPVHRHRCGPQSLGHRGHVASIPPYLHLLPGTQHEIRLRLEETLVVGSYRPF